MSTPQLDRLREHCHQLRLYQIETGAYCPPGTGGKERNILRRLPRSTAGLRGGCQNSQASSDADCDGALSVPEDAGELRMELTRFRRRCWGERKKEIPNATNPSTISAGVPAANHRTGARWTEDRASWRASSNPQPTRSANGSSRQRSMRVCAATALAPASARNSTGLGARTASCAKSARSYQKPRPGSLRRPPRRRRGVRVRRSQPGRASDSYHVPRARRLPERLLRAA